MKYLLRKILMLYVLISGVCTPLKSESSILSFKNLAAGAVGLSLVYAAPIVCSLMHELGHALTAKLLYGSPLEVHLNSKNVPYTTQEHTKFKEPTLFKKGPFYIHSLQWSRNWAYVNIPREKHYYNSSTNTYTYPYGQILISAAGPLAGFAAAVLLFKGAKTFQVHPLINTPLLYASTALCIRNLRDLFPLYENDGRLILVTALQAQEKDISKKRINLNPGLIFLGIIARYGIAGFITYKALKLTNNF